MRRLASGIVLVRGLPQQVVAMRAASGASNASAAEATSLYGAATRRAAGVSRPLPVFASRAARRGGPGGVPTTPGAARTVRSRPDASELETLVSHFR